MELKDIYEKLKATKLANEEFCKSERSLGLFLADVSIQPELSEKFLNLVPLQETAAYVLLYDKQAHESTCMMQNILNGWIKAFEKELNINPQDEEFPEILEMES